MKTTVPLIQWPYRFIAVVVFFSLFLFQGCDSFSGVDTHEQSPHHQEPSVAVQYDKLRHSGLLDSAVRTKEGQAGKVEATTVDLFLGFNPYEADGITPRLLDRYAITQRIVQEYGITRRVLDQYGITRRVLDQYGITRRILDQYGITRRVLDQYGITPRLLDQYDGQITEALLAEAGISPAALAEAGLSEADIDDFNKLSALLREFGITIEQFLNELDSFLQTLRVKIYIDNAHLGIAVAIDAAILEDFLAEISDDPDILFADPDFTIDLSDIGTTSGKWYDKQIVPWGISQIQTPIPSMWSEYWADYNTDQAVHVYLLDSGALVDDWMDDLYYVEKKDFTMLFENPEQLMWDDSMAPDVSGFDPGLSGNPYDESGHGAHIAGTIGARNNGHGVVGVAPGVRIHSLKVLTKEGRTDITTLLAAVDYVTRAKQANPDRPIVVNMSLGVDIGTTTYNVLDEAIETSIQAGVIYVAAAGNSGRDASTYSPAHVADVITVGAYNEKMLFSPFSNYGPAVDILAPGENIISLSHLISEIKAFESILASGTSYATAHVTGAAARYLGRNPNASPKQLLDAMLLAASSSVLDAPSGTTQKALDVGNLLTTSDTGTTNTTSSSNENDDEEND